MMGAPLDIEVNPNEVRGDAGLDRMVALIKGFKACGGLILTITGANREQLLAAQKEPEKYRNLRVRLGGLSAYFVTKIPILFRLLLRLGGLSAYFVTLSKEMQNSIIKRTEHSL